ncbi:hypothetical protein [Xanthomonas rydalmerensis]|uniref:Cytochrome c domain-containing protein n=2 Tax=Xanthomonas TaxID=338 RepID=A0ABZ0JP28_9XANT|nr:hypothetical protein [Xanthomonas sp. DM-2023]WOS40758.1 hypothetical protein QN243_20595 [Xanthomonas sp. DM-2023]WOS44942.1 hypothetical protein QN242_20595 [Xanthomonas sp. DM-2023]WOS49122.1 hypothetical protein QN240_20595 [Xanthomonas sp. DM-2023]WOS53302.1 hypothetical protein QN244_20600 [Xanthomonas sp. DM-2023]WOS57485.1 hypothetical protein QN245_20595 [Xanthomonas sp. DM-2023]
MHLPHPRILAIATALTLASGAASAGRFPDFGYAPPSTYTGPVFQLSQDYPQQPPSGPLPSFFQKLPRPLTNNFETWRGYADAVKTYCLEGNVESDWYVQNNKLRRWYHAPWQHYGPHGREGVHGLTQEAPIQAKQLAPTQLTSGQTFAVGIYNDVGGYTFGQVWKDRQNPDPSFTTKPNTFRDGTVVCKALFADVDLSQVPFLQNPVLWNAWVPNSYGSTDRTFKKVALIQMDFAVRDSRIPGTGWIFGTFQYNGAVSGKPGWQNLVPVGVMWGNDPQNSSDDYTNKQPTRTRINPRILQSAINAKPELPPTHLGWNGRLNGPVDNPVSSCMSCHMTAESPQLSPMNPTFQTDQKKIPPVGSKEWMRWFQNIPAGQPFDAAAKSTDYSLQLAGGIANFYEWKCTQDGVFVRGGNLCEQSKTPLKLMQSTTPPPTVYPVERGPSNQDQE